MTSMRELYGPWGPQEIASYLRVERATVDQWQQRGKLPQPRRVSGRPYWWADQIDDWAADTARIPTFTMLLSDGREIQDPGAAGWMLVDDDDSMTASIDYAGDDINEAIRTFWELVKIPDVGITKTEDTHGQWPSARVHLGQIRIPRTAKEWADSMDLLTTATGMDAGTLISWGYAAGTLCWVPLDPEHPDADDERGVVAAGDWVIGYDAQSGYWSER